MVLTGSTVSPAALDRMKARAREVALCPLCQENVAVGTLQHILWKCGGLRGKRVAVLGHSIPQMTAIQQGMAWPSGSPADDMIRAWHEGVRKEILAKRYVSGQ